MSDNSVDSLPHAKKRKPNPEEHEPGNEVDPAAAEVSSMDGEASIDEELVMGKSPGDEAIAELDGQLNNVGEHVMSKEVEIRDKYTNYVTPEEVAKLKEFIVLDEINGDEEEEEKNSDSSDAESEGVVPEDEIEKMLEEDLPEGFKGAPKPKERPYITRQKVVLEEKGVNHFEVLPLDWMMVRHYSGMPVYMHRATRVCTLSKPYFLGKGNTRRHDIPISAIPCYAYRRALEEEAKQKVIDQEIEEQIRTGNYKQNTNVNGNTNKPLDETSFQSAEKNVEPSKVSVPTTDADCETAQQSEIISLNSEDINVAQISFETTKDNDKNETKQNDTTYDLVRSIYSEDIQTFNMSEDFTIDNNTVHKDDDPDRNIYSEDITMTDAPNSSKVDIPDDSTKIVLMGSLLENQTHGVQERNNYEEINNITNETSQKPDQPVQTCPFTHEPETGASKENEGTAEGNEEIPLSRQPVVLPGGIVMPPPRVETVNTSWKTQHLTHEQINDYCKKLFKFKTVNIMHFKRWADRRKYTKARKTLQYPTLPEGTKLITIPAQPSTSQENAGKASKRDWVMNMNGRSYLSVFHEYVRRALQKQPVYQFKQLENASSPYQATVYIGGMQYGVGLGSSKRQAKSAAARASIHILIPEMRDQLDPATGSDPDFTFFDYVGIEDPRISEFCAATCEPSPHAILRTCLLRNFGAGDRHIHTEMKKLEYQKIELTMKVGKHSASVVCKNKKTAKQRASQAILQALHPHIRSWGSLLRLYGSRSVKSCKEKKQEEQQITLLQDKAQHNEPNYAVLKKLRNEMLKLRERDEAVVPIGTLLVKENLPTHSGSNLNNVRL